MKLLRRAELHHITAARIRRYRYDVAVAREAGPGKGIGCIVTASIQQEPSVARVDRHVARAVRQGNGSGPGWGTTARDDRELAAEGRVQAGWRYHRSPCR